MEAFLTQQEVKNKNKKPLGARDVGVLVFSVGGVRRGGGRGLPGALDWSLLSARFASVQSGGASGAVYGGWAFVAVVVV